MSTSAAPPLNLAARLSTASTRWDPSCVRGSSFVAVVTTLDPTDPDVSVGFAIRQDGRVKKGPFKDPKDRDDAADGDFLFYSCVSSRCG